MNSLSGPTAFQKRFTDRQAQETEAARRMSTKIPGDSLTPAVFGACYLDLGALSLGIMIRLPIKDSLCVFLVRLAFHDVAFDSHAVHDLCNNKLAVSDGCGQGTLPCWAHRSYRTSLSNAKGCGGLLQPSLQPKPAAKPCSSPLLSACLLQLKFGMMPRVFRGPCRGPMKSLNLKPGLPSGQE